MDSLFAWAQGCAGSLGRETSFDIPYKEGDAYRIKIIPALSDNYMFLIISTNGLKAVAVDPVDASKILSICEAENILLEAALTTHYHSDHSGGNEQLAGAIKGLRIYAGEGDADKTPAVTNRLANGELLTAAGLTFRTIATPCHTRGHVCFYLDGFGGLAPALFCGDTLFVAGCGRFMEGTAADMQCSLDALCTLPAETRIFCGHEYTVGNLQYALSLEPSNNHLVERLEAAKALRELGRPTIPSTLAEECLINPFLRVKETGFAESVGCPSCSSNLEIMAKLRRGKDTFTMTGKVITFALDVQKMLSGS